MAAGELIPTTYRPWLGPPQVDGARDVAGIGRLQRHVAELLGYLERNQDALVHYAARRRRGESISTAFVESAVNEIVAKRMNKILWAGG